MSKAIKQITYRFPCDDMLRRRVSCQDLLDFLTALRDVEGLDLSESFYTLNGGDVSMVQRVVEL